MAWKCQFWKLITPLQLSQNDRRIAVNIRADLHDRCASIPSRQRNEVRFWHNDGHIDARPCQILHPQSEADFLRKRRICVMVQNNASGISHLLPLVSATLNHNACCEWNEALYEPKKQR